MVAVKGVVVETAMTVTMKAFMVVMMVTAKAMTVAVTVFTVVTMRMTAVMPKLEAAKRM